MVPSKLVMMLEQFLKLSPEERKAMPVRESGPLWEKAMVQNLRVQTAALPEEYGPPSGQPSPAD